MMGMTGSVDAVFFDAGQTLIYVYPSVGSVYSEVARLHGVNADPQKLQDAFRAEWRRAAEMRPAEPPFASDFTSEQAERAWWREMVANVFTLHPGLKTFSNQFDAFFDDVFRHFAKPEAWRVYEDVTPTLDRLRQAGIPCAVVSNWDSRLPILLEQLGLLPYFAFVLTSAEIGCAKPDPRIFEAAVARLNVAPERTLHIGDSAVDDAAGAHGAGLRPILIDREARYTGEYPRLTTLTDLPNVLGLD